MEAKPLLRIQLPTTGPSSVFLQEDMKVLVRQGDYLMVVNLQSRSIEQKIPMPAYTGQPGTCVENFYYEVDSASLTKTNFVDIDQKKYNLDTHLNAQAFLAYDRVILTVSDGDLYCVYPDTLEVTFISKFVPASAVFQHNLNELGAIHDGKLHVCNMESHEVTSTETALQNFLIRCGESDYIQVADKISYKGESHGQASCMRSQPFINDQFVIIVDEAGQFEIIQTALLQNAQPYTATIKFNRSVFTPGEKKTQKKEYTVQDKLNDLVQQINILKSKTLQNEDVDVVQELKAIMDSSQSTSPQQSDNSQELQNTKQLLQLSQQNEQQLKQQIQTLQQELDGKSSQLTSLKNQLEQQLQSVQAQPTAQNPDSELMTELVTIKSQLFKASNENEQLKSDLRQQSIQIQNLTQDLQIQKLNFENELLAAKLQKVEQKPVQEMKPIKEPINVKQEPIKETIKESIKVEAKVEPVKPKPVQNQTTEVTKPVAGKGMTMAERIALFNKK
ncbi:Conserved_hypothetical protein [Hexamita inflata]|uniref:Uncharacterized protein n=1 Tax=Hexamita inflata TaxID=28002 RepID=A0AA86UHP2_9EUKA|nr:Conserved hypothetical protein [Hexamita inflata]